MGVVPPAGAISWLATCSRAASQDNARGTSLEQSQVIVPSTGPVWSAMSTPSVVPVSSGGLPGMSSIPVVPAGSYMGEGLLPIPERLTKKILQLEFVEMRELMPETWMRRRVRGPAEDRTGYGYSSMAPVLCWHGRRLVAEISSHGARTDGLSGYDRQV